MAATGVLQVGAGVVLGWALTLGTEFVKYRLTLSTLRTTERTARNKQARSEAYAPAVAILEAMIDSFPAVDGERERLRTLMGEKGYLLDVVDRGHLWVALSDEARLPDLVQVCNLLTDSMSEK